MLWSAHEELLLFNPFWGTEQSLLFAPIRHPF